MTQYIFAYHGGKKPESPEEGAAEMEKWNAWYNGMGDAVTHGGGPVGMSMTVESSGVSDGGGSNPVSGLTIVEAPNMEAACEMAKGCPILASGTVEVAELMQM